MAEARESKRRSSCVAVARIDEALRGRPPPQLMSSLECLRDSAMFLTACPLSKPLRSWRSVRSFDPSVFAQTKRLLFRYEKRAEGREIMVPLTSSLYVPGVMEDNKNVLVEVGAGYFIEKNTQAATEYCNRKSKALMDSSAKVGQLIQGKKGQLAR